MKMLWMTLLHIEPRYVSTLKLLTTWCCFLCFCWRFSLRNKTCGSQRKSRQVSLSASLQHGKFFSFFFLDSIIKLIRNQFFFLSVSLDNLQLLDFGHENFPHWLRKWFVLPADTKHLDRGTYGIWVWTYEVFFKISKEDESKETVLIFFMVVIVVLLTGRLAWLRAGNDILYE